jgi:hypothetical protein
VNSNQRRADRWLNDAFESGWIILNNPQAQQKVNKNRRHLGKLT